MAEHTHLELLMTAKLWLAMLVVEIGIDPETTVFRVRAAVPDGASRELAVVSLAQTLAEIDAALARAA